MSTRRVGGSFVAINLADGKQVWSLPQSDITEIQISSDDKRVACIERENFQQRDDYNSPVARVVVVDAATGKLLARAPMGRAVNRLLISPDGGKVVVRGADLDDMLYTIDTATGAIRRVRLPEAGGWAMAFSPDEKSVWIACGSLYRIDLDTLRIHTLPGTSGAGTGGQIVQLLSARETAGRRHDRWPRLVAQ